MQIKRAMDGITADISIFVWTSKP